MKTNSDFLTYGLGLVQVLLFFRLQSLSERISYIGPINFQRIGLVFSFVLLAAGFLLFFYNLNTIRMVLFEKQDDITKAKTVQALYSRTVFLIALILASSLLTRFM